MSLSQLFIDDSLQGIPSIQQPLQRFLDERNSAGGKYSDAWRASERILYSEICNSLGLGFRGIFLFSAEGSLDFRNTSLDTPDTLEQKIGHWDYVDCGFLEGPPNHPEEIMEPEYIDVMKRLGIINPEYLPKNGDGFWIHGMNGKKDKVYWERITKRSLSIRLIHWWVGTKKPNIIDNSTYDISYAESSQCEPHITCNELIQLVKIGGFIIIRDSYYSGVHIASPLMKEYQERVKAILVNPGGGFHMFQRTQ